MNYKHKDFHNILPLQYCTIVLQIYRIPVTVLLCTYEASPYRAHLLCQTLSIAGNDHVSCDRKFKKHDHEFHFRNNWCLTRTSDHRFDSRLRESPKLVIWVRDKEWSWKLGHRSWQDSRCMIGIMDFTVNASVLSSKDK